VERLDWDDLVEGYNRIKHKQCADAAALLADVLQNRTHAEASDILGISTDSIGRKLNEFRKVPKINSIKARFQSMDPEQMKGMTKLELASRLKCSVKYIEQLAKEFNRDYIRVLNNSIYQARQNKV
jgi:hypothetical protein